MKASTLADQSDIKVKGQCHLKICVLMSFDISFVSEFIGKKRPRSKAFPKTFQKIVF